MGLDTQEHIIKESMGKPKPGEFAIEQQEGKAVEWIHCRERFAGLFNSRIEGFYFSHECDRMQVVKFIEKTEKILERPTHCLFQPTQRNYATWVFPSEFWKRCPIHRSLFTLLLRAGQTYNMTSDNYEYTLYAHDYLKQTKEAVMRFLFGFTEFTIQGGWDIGWVGTFANKPIEEIRTKLVSPKPVESTLIGVGSLWR
jgi:hypothetical protein